MNPNRAFSYRANRLLCVAIAVFTPWLYSTSLSAQTLPPPPVAANKGLAAAPQIFVREFRFEGNTVFKSEELATVTAPFTNRELHTEDLEQARRAVTLHYVNRGYINSGAIIPDQDPKDGVIQMRIVEGVLTGTELHGNRWLRDGYIKGELRRWSSEPLNLYKMQEGLQLLRQNSNVQQINAELKPGNAPGQSLLDVRVEDQQPFRVGIQIDNQRPPTVGAEELSLLVADLNLTGNSDPLELRYGVFNSNNDGVELSGADNMEGSYRFPLTHYGTSIGAHASRLNTQIFEETFVDLDIKSLTTTYGADLRQAVYQTANQEAAISVGFEYRKNRTWLLDQRFNLSPGAEDGEMKVSALRFSQDWIQRGADHVLAFRSTFSFGLDAFNATDNGVPGDPDGKFMHWLGQGQYIQRLFGTQNELVLRGSGQWTSERLLALEQFSVGGFHTVRGYLENQLVRDRGFAASIEARIPVLFNKAGAGILHVVPFVDGGGGWNVNGSPDPTTIASTGIGLLFNPCKHASAEFYWGYRLRHIHVPDDAGAQGLGIGFRVNINAF